MGAIGKKKFDWTAAALGFLSPQAGALYSKRKAENRKDQAEAEILSQQRAALKELGWSDAEVAAMTPQDASQLLREKRSPFTLSAGSARYDPGMGGSPERVIQQPHAATNLQREVEYYRSIGRDDLANAALAKNAAMIHSAVDPATGQTILQAINPSSLFPPSRMPRPATSDDEWEYSPPPQTNGGPAPSGGRGIFPYGY